MVLPRGPGIVKKGTTLIRSSQGDRIFTGETGFTCYGRNIVDNFPRDWTMTVSSTGFRPPVPRVDKCGRYRSGIPRPSFGWSPVGYCFYFVQPTEQKRSQTFRQFPKINFNSPRNSSDPEGPDTYTLIKTHHPPPILQNKSSNRLLDRVTEKDPR